MLGIATSLIAAAAWAGSSIINKFLTTRIDTLSLNTLRLWVGSILLISIALLTGRGDALFFTPAEQLLLIAAAGLVAISIGDTIYIAGLSYIDVSRAFPIAQCTFPVLTMVIAIFFLKEPFSLINIMGGLLVVVGIYMVAVIGKRNLPSSPDSKKSDARGVLLALSAAVAWTTGAVVLKLGVTGVDPFVAAAIRVPVAAIALTGFVLSRKKGEVLQFQQYGSRNMALAVTAGILTYGVASIAYVTAMQLIGAGKTVLITAIAPILILPFSIVLLKERPTYLALIGIITGVIGLIFVSLN